MATSRNSGYSNLKNNYENDGPSEERKTLLNYDSDDDEDAIFNKPSSEIRIETAQVHGKLEGVRLEIRKVTDVMLDNVQKVMERGERLDDLASASERLSMAGAEFESSARKAHRRGWLQNLVSKYAVLAIILFILVTVIVIMIVRYS